MANYGLYDLEEITGKSLMDMVQDSLFESSVDAICVECGDTSEMEPDQTGGYCENCKTNTIVSGLVLGGVI